MARKPRVYSSSGFYHLYMRGNDQQELFYDDDDRKIFISKIYKYADELNIDVYTYTLMDNHVHLEIGNATETMGLFVKKLACSYVPYFNKKYKRSGHLFQGRYQSEPIENIEYFLATLGYIINNPQRAGICNHKSYRWSNYKSFLTSKSSAPIKRIIEIFGTRKNLIKYLESGWQEDYELTQDSKKGSDQIAIDFIKQLYNLENLLEIKRYSINKKKEIIRNLHHIGFSGVQLSRILGICKGSIYKMVN